MTTLPKYNQISHVQQGRLITMKLFVPSATGPGSFFSNVGKKINLRSAVEFQGRRVNLERGG